MNNQVNTEIFIEKNLRILPCNQGPLELTFFSEENIDLINKKLIMEVFKETNIKINHQTSEDLLIVMLHIYKNHSKFKTTNVKHQVYSLDCKTVKEIKPAVIGMVKQKVEYIKEINNPRQLIDLPKNVNNTRNLKPYDFVVSYD
jgi:hypothetical protein